MLGALFTPYTWVCSAAEVCFGEASTSEQGNLTHEKAIEQELKSSRELANAILSNDQNPYLDLRETLPNRKYTVENSGYSSSSRPENDFTIINNDYNYYYWDSTESSSEVSPCHSDDKEEDKENEAAGKVAAALVLAVAAACSMIAGYAFYSLTKDCLRANEAEKELSKCEVRAEVIRENSEVIDNYPKIKKLLTCHKSLLTNIRNSYAVSTILKTSMIACSVFTAYCGFKAQEPTTEFQVGVSGVVATATLMLMKHARDSIFGDDDNRKFKDQAKELKKLNEDAQGRACVIM